MSERIKKTLKIKHTCKSCRKPFTNKIEVTVRKDFAISDLTYSFYKSFALLKECPICKNKSLKISYSFSHTENVID